MCRIAFILGSAFREDYSKFLIYSVEMQTLYLYKIIIKYDLFKMIVLLRYLNL